MRSLPPSVGRRPVTAPNRSEQHSARPGGECRVRSNRVARSRLIGGTALPDRGVCSPDRGQQAPRVGRPSPLFRARGRLLGSASIQALAIGVESVDSWPCGQDSRPEARMPPTARSAPRGVRRGSLVLTAGSVSYFYRRYPTGPVVASYLIERAGVLALSFRAGRTGGREGLKTMTHRRQDLAARRRGELTGDHGSRRLSPAIDAQRRLNSRRADGAQTKGDPFGPSDPRYAYLTRSHD